jgi:hypothetical protein
VAADEPAALTLRVREGSAPRDLESAESGSHTLVVDGLAPGRTVAAAGTLVDLAGNALRFNVNVSAFPDVTLPGSVAEAAARDLGDGHVRLSWTPAQDDSGIAWYVVRRTFPDATRASFDDLRGTSFVDAIPVGTQARYSVAAVDLGGNEGPATILTVTSRAVARITAGEVQPPSGGPGTYRFEATVVSSDGADPEVTLLLDGVEVAMKKTSGDCRAGCKYGTTAYVGATSLTLGPHQYSFQVASAGGNATYPVDGRLEGPVVIAGDPAPAGEAIAGASKLPALGATATLAVLSALGLAIAIWRRRP